jgi:septum formation protein
MTVEGGRSVVPEAPRFVLASGSPSRLRLLRDAGIDPEVAVSGVDETVGMVDVPTAVALLAARKGTAVRDGYDDALVLACDSMLAIDGEGLGKPSSPGVAVAYWRRLSGRTARLYTGHWLIDTRTGESVTDTVGTAVHFATPTDAEIEAYVATGEPLQAAGAFTLEGYGAPFVESIEGDVSNVQGLSLPALRLMLARLGTGITQLWRGADRG